MGTTLARRIRRIGIQTTTFIEHVERKSVKNEQGIYEEITTVKHVPVRNQEELSREEIHSRKLRVTAEWRSQHQDGRASRS